MYLQSVLTVLCATYREKLQHFMTLLRMDFMDLNRKMKNEKSGIMFMLSFTCRSTSEFNMAIKKKIITEVCSVPDCQYQQESVKGKHTGCNQFIHLH